MRIVDMLRGRYVASPGWLKKLAAPALSLLPTSLLYGDTYRKVANLIELSKSDPAFVRTYQSQILIELIESCRSKSEYYREIFKGVFDDSNFWRENCFYRLQELPLLTREIIRANLDRLLVKPESELDEVSTSGSSGQPLKFFLDRDRSPKELAFIHTIWSRIGFCPGKHRRAVLRGVFLPNVDEKPWEYDPALKELKLSPFHLVPERMALYLDLLRKYEINFIHGYPSAITILSGFAKSIGWEKPSCLLGVLPISEAVFSHQRSIVLDALGGEIKILSFYGQSEKVAIAGESEDFSGVFEFEPLYGIVELLDEQGRQICEKGRRGKIVATGLMNKGMPLLRYDTGDIAELVELGTNDNCYRTKVRNIRSRRAQEYIVGYNGALISFSAINLHSKHFSNIQQFQLCQNKPGEVTVTVVPYPGQDESSIRPFVSEIQSKVGNNVDFRLQLVESIPSNPRGKRHFIKQDLLN